MSRSRASVIAVALVALAFLAGCTTSEAGEAKPDPTSEPSGDGPTSATGEPSADVPPPPTELSLVDIDPCALFTDEQRAQLKVNDVRSDVGNSEIYEGMKECTLDADAEEPFRTYNVIAVTDVDMSFWLDDGRNADAELISVGGFPAAEFHTKGVEDSDCAVALGVAKNQHLHVEMVPISEELAQEELCQASEQAAEMALQTLQTLR